MPTAEERARIPPGLPRDNPTTSYWQDPPSDIANHRTTPDLPTIADYIIIGSGISGAFIAYNLLTKQPNAKVLLLEARQACSGATGRNGGHTKAASYREFLVHEREFGLDEAIRIARLEYDNIKATHAFAREHGIECASTECQTVDVCYSQREFDYGVSAVNRMRDVFPANDPVAEYKIHDSKATAEKFLCPGSVGSIEYFAGSLSAYDFTIGVLKLCLEKGLNLQTNTPVEGILAKFPSGNTPPTYNVTTLRRPDTPAPLASHRTPARSQNASTWPLDYILLHPRNWLRVHDLTSSRRKRPERRRHRHRRWDMETRQRGS